MSPVCSQLFPLLSCCMLFLANLIVSHDFQCYLMLTTSNFYFSFPNLPPPFSQVFPNYLSDIYFSYLLHHNLRLELYPRGNVSAFIPGFLLVFSRYPLITSPLSLFSGTKPRCHFSCVQHCEHITLLLCPLGKISNSH